LPASIGGIDAAAILGDGRVVATDASSRLRIIDPDRKAILADLKMPARGGSLRASSDGLRLIVISLYTTSAASPPVLWNLQDNRMVGQLEGHRGRVFSARFVRGGASILTAGGDGTARLWDTSTGRLRQTYRGSSRFLADATLAPDGFVVVGGDADGRMRFWDSASARPLWVLQAHKSNVIGVHFEGEDIVTRGFAGDISRWTLPKPDPMCGASESGLDSEPCAIVPQ
jgi:WD40 repeat protein